MGNPEPSRSSWRILKSNPFEHHGFAAGFLLLLTLVYTYPAVFQLSTHLLGGIHSDAWQWPWNIFIFREQVIHGQDPYYTNYLYYPVGTSLLFHTYTEFNGALGLVLHPFLNDIAITNVASLLATFLSAFGTYLLARRLTGNASASIFAAIAFAFCPFRTIRMMYHLNLAMTQWIPFTLWAFLRLSEKPGVKNSLLAGLFFALTCYCNYPYGIYLAIALFIILACGILLSPLWRSFAFAKACILAGFTALALLFPIPLHLYNDFHARPLPYYGSNFEHTSARIGDYLAAAPNNPYIRDFVDNKLKMTLRNEITSGWTALAAGFIGVILIFRLRERKMIPFLAIGFVFFLLSLGPSVKLGHTHTMPLPYALLVHMPIMQNLRIPARFAIMVTLVIALLGAYGIAEVLKKMQRRSVLICSIVLVIVMTELAAFPLPMAPYDPPGIFYSLQKREGDVMITVPYDLGEENKARASYYLAFQATHRKKMLNGKISRDPYPEIEYFGSIPIASTLHRLTNGANVERFENEDRNLAPYFRRFFDVRYLTLFPPFSERPDILQYVNDVFPDARLLAIEKEIRVYELPALSKPVLQFRGDEMGIRFFLLENWETRLIKGTYRTGCWSDTAKILLPKARDDRPLGLRMRIRSGSPDEGARLRFSVGNQLLLEDRMTGTFHNLSLDIPGSILAEAHQVLSLTVIHGSSEKKATDSSRVESAKKQPTLEIDFIKAVFNAKNGVREAIP